MTQTTQMLNTTQGDHFHLIPTGQNLWTVETPFKFFGAHIGNRMSVILLNNNQLLLHSPVDLQPALQHSISALGHVSYLIAPNCEHNLFFSAWQTAFPDATTLMAENTKKLDNATPLTDAIIPTLMAQWKQEITLIPIRGIPKLNECVLIHHASKTLILTDLAFHITPTEHLVTRWISKLYGIYNKFGPTPLVKALIKDKDAFYLSIETILSHDFKRIILSHGSTIEQHAKQQFRDAFTL